MSQDVTAGHRCRSAHARCMDAQSIVAAGDHANRALSMGGFGGGSRRAASLRSARLRLRRSAAVSPSGSMSTDSSRVIAEADDPRRPCHPRCRRPVRPGGRCRPGRGIHRRPGLAARACRGAMPAPPRSAAAAGGETTADERAGVVPGRIGVDRVAVRPGSGQRHPPQVAGYVLAGLVAVSGDHLVRDPGECDQVAAGGRTRPGAGVQVRRLRRLALPVVFLRVSRSARLRARMRAPPARIHAGEGGALRRCSAPG